MTEGGRRDLGRSIWQRPAPTESPRANSRAALVDAAYAEFSAKGYEAATVAGIAERAGVTTGALYAHFRGKLDLLLEVLGMSPVEDVLAGFADLGRRPWSEVSRVLSEGMSTPPDRRTLLVLDVIVVARRDPGLAEILRSGLRAYLAAIEQGAEGGAALGLLAPALPPPDLARVLGLLNLGMVVFGALDLEPPGERAFARLADLLLQGSSGGDERTDQPSPLARVRARAAALDRARRALHEEIVSSVEAGQTLRQVGEAAGVSHERVRQVLREHRGSTGSSR